MWINRKKEIIKLCDVVENNFENTNNNLFYLESNMIEKANKYNKTSEIDKIILDALKNNKGLLPNTKIFWELSRIYIIK